LECDSYIKDQWISAVLTFLSVGTSAMAESSFVHFGCQKYGFSRPHRWNFDDSDFRFRISSKFEPSKHIDLHMWCHFESTLF